MQGGPSELNCARPRKTEKQDRRNPAALAQRSQVLHAFRMQEGRTRHPHSLFFTEYMREKEMDLHKVNPT